MIKEIINKDSSLEELINKNDFEFINTLESNVNEIHQEILEQKNKRKHVMNLSSTLANKDTTDETNTNAIKDANEIIGLINSNISSLYTVEVYLNNICQNLINSYISDSLKSDSNSAFDSIKSNINTYSNELANFNSTLEQNNIKIDNYLKQNTNSSQDHSNVNAAINSEMHVDNPYLVVSEKDKKVFLPYKVSEINSYLAMYPNSYSSFEDVIEKEFIRSLNYYTKNPIHTRFRETYSLIRDREGKSVLEALKYSFDLMFKRDLNPCIIAACKNQAQLDDYLRCLEHQTLDDFTHFKIQFYVNPL